MNKFWKLACGGVIFASLLLIGTGLDSPATRPAATAPADGPQSLDTTTMRLGNLRFRLQIANDPAERETGLMHVEQMPRLSGMIFVFPRPARLAFWMKNTLIPLDIVYLDARGRVLNVERMVPGQADTTPSAGPAQWAVELNAGMADAAGVKPGDVVLVPPKARPNLAE